MKKDVVHKLITVISLVVAVILAFSMDGLAQGKISRKPNDKASKQSTNVYKRHNNKHSRGSISVSHEQIHKVSEPDGYLNGYGYVDLGLPSGVKWATCNLGANQPDQVGNYYVWGSVKAFESESDKRSEPEPKFDIGGNIIYDAATYNWGKEWRIPSISNIKEILKHCDLIFCNFNGCDGLLIKGKSGKSIFLPFTESTLGFYWLSNVDYCISFRHDSEFTFFDMILTAGGNLNAIRPIVK